MGRAESKWVGKRQMQRASVTVALHWHCIARTVSLSQLEPNGLHRELSQGVLQITVDEII